MEIVSEKQIFEILEKHKEAKLHAIWVIFAETMPQIQQ